MVKHANVPVTNTVGHSAHVSCSCFPKSQSSTQLRITTIYKLFSWISACIQRYLGLFGIFLDSTICDGCHVCNCCDKLEDLALCLDTLPLVAARHNYPCAMTAFAKCAMQLTAGASSVASARRCAHLGSRGHLANFALARPRVRVIAFAENLVLQSIEIRLAQFCSLVQVTRSASFRCRVSAISVGDKVNI